MSDLPTNVLVGAVRYRVVMNDNEWMKIEHASQRLITYGQTDNQKATIALNPAAAPEVQRLTLWHEVLHALHETTMGSPDWRGLGKDHDQREETVIRMWEHPTLAVLRDNPQLVAYLTSKDAE